MIDPRSQQRRKARSRTLVIILAAIALTGALAAGAWYYVTGWRPDDSTYPMQGIDVSQEQGRIAWQALPAQGVDFAYIRASEGDSKPDTAFAANWADAGKAGIRRGAYHVFTLCAPGRNQANAFIRAARPDPESLPPAVTLRFLDDCTARPDLVGFHAEMEAFLDAVEAHFGAQAILMLDEDFDSFYGVSAGIDRPLWLSADLSMPEYGSRPWTIWRANSFFRLDGIDGATNWNVLRGQSGSGRETS